MFDAASLHDGTLLFNLLLLLFKCHLHIETLSIFPDPLFLAFCGTASFREPRLNYQFVVIVFCGLQTEMMILFVHLIVLD